MTREYPYCTGLGANTELMEGISHSAPIQPLDHILNAAFIHTPYLTPRKRCLLTDVDISIHHQIVSQILRTTEHDTSETVYSKVPPPGPGIVETVSPCRRLEPPKIPKT